MHIPSMGLDLEVRIRGSFPQSVVLRVEKMVRAVLPHTANGRWRLDLIGGYPPLQEMLQYHLEIQPLGDIPIMLRVAARSSLRNDPVSGLLRMAPSLGRSQLLQDITPAIQDLNQRNWQGILEREIDHSLQGEGIVSLPPPSISSPKGTIMNNPVSVQDSIEICLSDADGIPPATTKIGLPMLKRLLEDADAVSGTHTVKVAGKYARFDTISDNCVEVELGNRSDAVLIRVRARYGPTGNFFGFLLLQPGVKREQFCRDLAIAARALNESKWKEVIDNIPPEPSGRSPASPLPPPERVSTSALKVPAPIPVSAPAPTASSGATTLPVDTTLSQPTIVRPASDLPKFSAEVVRLVKLLKSILQDPQVKNGVFLGKALMGYANPLFQSDEHTPGWIGRLLHSLEFVHRFIRRVDQGQYQVEEEFVRNHFPSASIQPLPKAAKHPPRLANATSTQADPATKMEKKAGNGTIHPPALSAGNGMGDSALESLTAHLRQVDELIAKERQRLEAAVIVAQEKVRLIEQSLEDAKEGATVAEVALQSFNQSLQAMLSQSQLAVRE